jgi:hypothetical protein
MSEPDDPNQHPPDAPVADVVSIEDARKKSEERAAQEAAAAAAAPKPSASTQAVLQPVMAAILKELSGLAGPDGTVKLGGEDAAARAKTAAVLKGIGAGLGAALADAFGRWAERVHNANPAATTPATDGTSDPNATAVTSSPAGTDASSVTTMTTTAVTDSTVTTQSSSVVATTTSSSTSDASGTSSSNSASTTTANSGDITHATGVATVSSTAVTTTSTGRPDDGSGSDGTSGT